MKTINWIIVIAICGLLFGSNTETKAQQFSEYTQYMFNPVIFNPAYTGSRGIVSTRIMYRNQWDKIEGAPKTFNFSAHSPFRDSNAAIGLWVENDNIGFTQSTRINGTFAYHIPVNKKIKLSLGIDAGVTNWSINFGDEKGNFQVEDRSDWFPNVGAGLWLYGKRFYIGLSAPDLLADENDNSGAIDEEIHYYGTAGVVIPMGRSLKFKPTIMVKAVEDIEPEVDLTAHFLIRDFLWLGIAWSVGVNSFNSIDFDSIDFLAEIKLTDQLVAGYSYDLTNAELRSHGLATHELMLGYDFCFTRDKIVTPRYF